MWKHCCLLVCSLAAFFASETTASAQDTSTLPLVQFADLVYYGAFRLPPTALNGDDLSIGGRPFTYNPIRNSLFVGSRAGRIAEVTIPQAVNTNVIASLNYSTYLQGFADPMEGNLWQVASDGAAIEGLLVQGGQMYGTAAIYYDANNIQRGSHYSRALDLFSPSFVGVAPVWRADHAGFVAGYMATVPPEWQAKLGGPAVTGQCCTPIAWKTSWGPSAFAWTPTSLGGTALVPATPLLYYSNEHPTLGHWNATGNAYGATTLINGLALIAGSRTALFFGSTGTGPACYGDGTSIQSLHGTPSPDGTIWCYDPTNTDKGSHAYPYRYQIWAYDLNDFAAVKEGRKQPWEVLPYGVWPFELPVPEPRARLGGVGYDAQRQILYVSQMYADQDGYAGRALIHALKIAGVPGSSSSEVAPPPPVTSGSGTVKSVTLAANRTAPQAPGTAITWTAVASGGILPHQYQWWTYDGSTWTAASSWTTANTYVWTPVTASSSHRVAVWVRSAGSYGSYETSAEIWFAISGTATAAPAPAPAPSARTSAVSITANLTAPQPAYTTVTWTAAPTGGVAPHQYQWWTYDGTSWVAATAWTTTNTLAWRPTVANPNHRVAVWVRSAGQTSSHEAATEVDFPIAGTATTVPAPTPTTTSTARTTAVVLTANKAAPQPPNTTITWTALPAGGVAPHQYQWWVFDGANWVSTPWSTSSTFAWIPTIANANYRVAVWVRSAGSSGSYEATAEQYFAISGAPTVVSPPPAPTSARATGATISSNLAQPQVTGTAITWTATVTGGVAPYQYQWWTFDGTKWTSSAWTTSSTFVWVPTVAHSNSRVAVWVRSAGNTSDHEASAEAFFAIWQRP